ncbi:hypothetical protein EYS14_21565 [Alteromonadaceae bacterium M269]|nr:hypothetical protein EYS14_21565 [Alteromonadaceae bacterium M269]
MKRASSYLAAAIALAFSATSAVSAEHDSNWYQQAAISPDGKHILFAAKGDIYKVDVNGGNATPLTSNSAWDGTPIWSKDGKTIAFSSDRNGSLDVYTMPASGGAPTRLTYHSSDDTPTDFSADGKSVIFNSGRTNSADSSGFPTGAMRQLYEVSLKGGTPTQLMTTPALEARYNRNGRKLAYMDNKAYENVWRKHDTSAFARDIWVVDTRSNKHTQLTNFKGGDSTPVWSPDGKHLYYLSEQESNSFNIWKMPAKGGKAERVTNHDTHPVRSLSISKDGLLSYTWHGNLYTIKDGGRPQKLDVALNADSQGIAVKPASVANKATEFWVSPNGKEIAFVSRGEVFVTSVEFGTTVRVTNTPTQERSLSWSEDGRSLIYAAERNNNWGLYQSTLADENELYFYTATKIEEKPLLQGDKDAFQPSVSPDGKKVAFLHQRDEIRVLDIESGKVNTALSKKYNYSYADGDMSFDWSPDSEWIVASYVPGSRVFISSIAIVPADGSAEPRDISLSGYGDGNPKWVNNDMIIYSSGKYGRRNHGSWGNDADVMAVFLTQEAFDNHNLTKEERALAKELEEKLKKDEKDSEDKKDEKDDDKVELVKIDWDGIEERSVRLTIHSSELGDSILTDDGEKLYYLASFDKGYDLWLQDFKERSTKLVAKLGANSTSLELSEDGKTLFVLADGKLQKMGVGDHKPKGVAFNGAVDVDADAEREYMLGHIWRQTRDKFYDPGMHGIDWDQMGKDYMPKVKGINNNRDFAILASELLGELNSSHTGGRYQGRPPAHANTASLGVIYGAEPQKGGVLIEEILPKSPLKKASAKIEAGMLLTHVDGEPVNAANNLYSQLNGKANKRVRLTLKDGNKSFETVIKPVSRGAEAQSMYERWVESRREYVNKISNGRIGYVHVRQMNDASFRQVYADLFGKHFETEAVVVDTRFNGGGWLHDDLVVLLGGKQYTKMLPRGREYQGDPIERWTKPSIVLMNEGNYSDGYIFPVAYKANGLGKTIGMPVPGTGTPVWWERLHTGDIVFGIPQIAVTDMQGNVMENNQLEPDILINNLPEEVSKGEDPQLKRAVEELLK